MVELLISSNICRYSEFRSVDHVITLLDDQFKQVPCARSDVFNSKEINVIEKRLLMKLLTNCLNYTEEEEHYKSIFLFVVIFEFFFSLTGFFYRILGTKVH